MVPVGDNSRYFYVYFKREGLVIIHYGQDEARLAYSNDAANKIMRI